MTSKRTLVVDGTPSRAERAAARRAMLEISARRQRPGSGSQLDRLMAAKPPTRAWWPKAAAELATGGVRLAVTGAVAANAYMPPRYTGDLDLAIEKRDLVRAGKVMKANGWMPLGDLHLYEGLAGTAWERGDREVDLIGLPGAWGRAAIDAAQSNRRVMGLPTLTLPFLVVMKLISARPQDTADISRMLGPADDADIALTRATVSRFQPTDAEDLEQMIVAGRLEFRRPA